MKFFIDTANLKDIAEAHDMGILDGVTTNPSLMAKEGITGKENILNHYVAICNIVDGPVSAEVIATDFEGMVREGEELAALHKNIVVKIPMLAEGLKAIKYFSAKGIRTNCTLIFSAGQALVAAKAGATTAAGKQYTTNAATWTKAARSYELAAKNFERTAASLRDKINEVAKKEKQKLNVQQTVENSKTEVSSTLQNRRNACRPGL